MATIILLHRARDNPCSYFTAYPRVASKAVESRFI